jgi:hypothetical protein
VVEREFNSIEEVAAKIIAELNTPHDDTEKTKKVSIVYASNASGKTRLSKNFNDENEEEVFRYNAYIEDLFTWNNENYTLKIVATDWVFKLVKDQGLDRQIIDNYKRLTGSSVEPIINIDAGMITFNILSGDEGAFANIKISRGEESVLIWSIYFTILQNVIETLNVNVVGDRSTDAYNRFKYILIDDPVSSMDDTRIISIALDIAELIHNSKSDLKFLLTTHHPLFFNVLYNAGKSRKNWDRKNYVLFKSGQNLTLKNHGHDSPFAYHHVVIAELAKAIKEDDIKKYHFNLFRSLLEKTANFLGYYQWQVLLEGGPQGRDFKKIIEHFSHNSLSDLEYKDLDKEKIEEFKAAFDFFIEKFKWGMKT